MGLAFVAAMAFETPASILVIDDDRPFARSVQILLEDEGHHRVAVATSINLALAALTAITELDVLIIDLAILEANDVRLDRAIHDRPGGVAVIVMTAHAAALDAAHLRSIDAAGLLAKPIDPSTLLAMVAEATDNRQLHPEGRPRTAPERAHTRNRGAPAPITDHSTGRKP